MTSSMTSEIRQWFVPGRVNLIGEHLDYVGGLTLPFAIDRGTTVKARRRGDTRVAVWSGGRHGEFDVTVEPGALSGWQAYVGGSIWAFSQAGHHLGGVDLVIESTLPIGAGLSSSAALTCAIALALNDLGGFGLDRHQIAAIAQRAETDFVGVPVGRLDQLAVLFAQPEHALLIDHRTEPPGLTDVPFDPSSAGLALALIDTRVHHDLAAGEYAARRDECENARSQLELVHLAEAPVDAVLRLDDPTLIKRTRHAITETARVRGSVNALRTGNWRQLGAMLTASHASLRDDYEVSCPELDAAVDIAIEHGALGARMTGGGFGGCVIALVPSDRAAAMSSAVSAAFAERSWAAPVVAPVRPSGGARGLA